MRTPIQIRCRQCKKLRDPEFFHNQNLCECCEGTCPVCEDEGIYREEEVDGPSPISENHGTDNQTTT